MYKINRNVRNFGLVALLAGSLLGAINFGKNEFDGSDSGKAILPNSIYEDPKSYLKCYKDLEIIRKGTETVDLDGDKCKDLLAIGEVPSKLFYPDGAFSRIYSFKGHKDGGYYCPPKLLIDKIFILNMNVEISDLNNDGKKDIKVSGNGKGKGFDDMGFGTFTFINGKDFSL